jgi:AcrR family transcriptional regulator
MRQAGEQRDSELHEQLMKAALVIAGRSGYRNTTVSRIVEHLHGYRGQFYRHFRNVDDCYAKAYASWIERLIDRLGSAAGAQSEWADGLQAGLEELANFIAEDRELARGLLAEIELADGTAHAKRQEVFERLSRAIDSARRESSTRHSPPPLTAEFMVRAINAAVFQDLRGQPGEPFVEQIPALVDWISTAYLADQAPVSSR